MLPLSSWHLYPIHTTVIPIIMNLNVDSEYRLLDRKSLVPNFHCSLVISLFGSQQQQQQQQLHPHICSHCHDNILTWSGRGWIRNWIDGEQARGIRSVSINHYHDLISILPLPMQTPTKAPIAVVAVAAAENNPWLNPAHFPRQLSLSVHFQSQSNLNHDPSWILTQSQF